jgi:hypothetical protein
MNQYEPLKFNENGIPRNANYYMQNDVMFNNNGNNQYKFVESSEFNENMDGRYGVTSDMTHNNMEPFFKSKTYGFNPDRIEKMADRSSRNVNLFTGSDSMLQFKHKQEVEELIL